jgi:hypothetical protein
MSSLYIGQSIDASCPVSVHLAKQLQRRRFFRNRPTRETRIACGGHVCKQIGTKSAFLIEDLP